MNICDYCVYLEKLESIGGEKVFDYCYHYLIPEEGKQECDKYFRKDD